MTANANDSGRLRPVIKQWLLLLLTAGVVGVLGMIISPMMAGPESVPAMWIGVAIALGGALLATLPQLLPNLDTPNAKYGAVMSGMGIRMFLTLGVLLLVCLKGFQPRTPLAIWTVVAYMALLVVETVTVVRLTSTTKTDSSK